MPSKKGNRSDAKISLNHDNNDTMHDYEVADYMNNFFVSLGDPNRPPDDATNEKYTPQPLIQNQADNNFTLDPITTHEINTLVRKINISKSSGITLLSSKLIKDSFLELNDHLAFLFNLCIRTAIFPDQWKKALVIPIPKGGNSKKVENFRPISLLPLPGKLLEKLIHTHLIVYNIKPY